MSMTRSVIALYSITLVEYISSLSPFDADEKNGCVFFISATFVTVIILGVSPEGRTMWLPTFLIIC